MADSGKDFIVRLEGVKLPPAAAQALAREIQGTVLRELARLDLGGDLKTHIPRRDWIGIVLSRAQGPQVNPGVLRVEKIRK